MDREDSEVGLEGRSFHGLLPESADRSQMSNGSGVDWVRKEWAGELVLGEDDMTLRKRGCHSLWVVKKSCMADSDSNSLIVLGAV